jgi:hypothetical protein
LRLELAFIGLGLRLAFPTFVPIAIVIVNRREDPISPLLAIEYVFLEVADRGVFGREELTLR